MEIQVLHMCQHQEWVQLAVIMQLCKSGDHIVSSRTIYGGSYAFRKTLPKLKLAHPLWI